MPAADFAAAQERIAARRAQRQRAHHEHTPKPTRLPNSLTSIFSTISGREGTRPAFRVGQVDAELLDNELLDLLKGQVGEALKYFGSHITDNWSAEILLALRLVLFKLSIWDQNASYGAHLQGLRYTDARSSAPNRPPPTRWQKIAYGLIGVGGRYAWGKWEDHLLATQEDYTVPESPTIKLLASLTERMNSLHDVASLASFLVFLVNGRYRTLTDRLLRLRLTPASHETSREVSFEYLNRQLVWHAFTEFLLFLLPLVGISRWRRILQRTWRKIRTSLYALFGRTSPKDDSADEQTKRGELSFLPERTCAICYRDQNPTSATSEADILASSAGGGGVVGSAATDITNPYEALPCGCIYCFACLAQRIANEEGEGWTCLRCGAVIKECRAWNGDVVEERRQHDRPASRDTSKSVGFATTTLGTDDVSDDNNVLREIDPMPEHEDGVESEDTRLEKTRGLDLGDSLAFTESSEWAREDTEEESEGEDEQSEEYDEDEEEEGEELGGGFDYDQ